MAGVDGVDQGGCVKTSRPTTLKEPTFLRAGLTHYYYYCVKNVPVTATRALSNALNSWPALRRGVVVAEGRPVEAALARASRRELYPLPCVPPLRSEVG